MMERNAEMRILYREGYRHDEEGLQPYVKLFQFKGEYNHVIVLRWGVEVYDIEIDVDPLSLCGSEMVYEAPWASCVGEAKYIRQAIRKFDELCYLVEEILHQSPKEEM